ncbi:universal stress protein [Pontibacter sp. G13]|uniref:universal stress protein n=1 Tax=Pontibacter sp. G13 TaxID=3074898 RepID=UPI002889D336|nr:universal stress protein [Pontibacter sp. G13]WNJ20856.1 universal stress protein [Pontibacter sp. G13]
MRHILIPTDFSLAAQNAYQYSMRLTRQMPARLSLLHVLPERPVVRNYEQWPTADPLQTEKVEEAMKRFDQFRNPFGSLEVKEEVLIETGQPAHEILHSAVEESVDLIVMGRDSSPKPDDAFFGNVLSTVMYDAKCPVLIVPEKYPYRPIQHVMYATTFRARDLTALDKVSEEAFKMGAKVSCVHIERNSLEWREVLPNTQAAASNGATQAAQQPVTYVSFDKDHLGDGLNEFIREHRVDLVVMVTQPRNLFDQLLRPSMTGQIAASLQVPMMVYHKAS